MRIHYQDRPFLHPAKPGHPERPHRQMAALSGLAQLPAGRVSWEPVAPLALSEAEIAHDKPYLAMLAEADCSRGAIRLDAGDTLLSESSLGAALAALGGARAATAEIVSNRTKSGFLVARPPGHHACRSEAMGFCLLGTAAWAALDARRRHGARVAVLDFDLHHGNGTQDILWDTPDVFFASSHEDGNWPRTGVPSERGAHGQIRNRLLRRGSGSDEMRAAWSAILDRVAEFAPDFVVVSAGFDAHGDDPLSGLDWAVEDYAWLGARLAELADGICGGRLLSILEGGYDLQVLRHGIAAYAHAVSELDASEESAASPALGLGGWRSPYIGGALAGSDGHDLFRVRKVNGRMWIEETESGQLLYTPPEFIRLRSRDPLRMIAAEANAVGDLHIDRIIALEAAAERAAGFNPGRSRDFSAA